MAIWHGYGGGLRLERAKTGPAYVWIEAGDVDAPARRMSADRAVSALVTGDYVSIAHVDENGGLLSDPLPFLAKGAWGGSDRYPDGQWYVNVDPIGGVRLFHQWKDALDGNVNNAMPMEAVKERCRVRVQLVADNQRCLAQTTSWELNTNRNVADITPLGEGFAKNMATLVSGSGALDCLFTAGKEKCGSDDDHERSMYLHQLALRQEIGANFIGVFLLKRRDTLPVDLSPEFDKAELFYLCNCVISNVASSVDVDDIIHSRIEFVTTDQIQLLYSYPTSYLLQEVGGLDKIVQENSSGILVDLPL